MFKKSLLLMLLMTLLAPWAAQAQTTVEIGDGTVTTNYVPIGTYYNYSITEQLYTADEIGMGGTISSISFYYAGTVAKDFPITVYMANVDAADLSTGISLADADEVFDGTLSVTGAGWATIELDTPFAYDDKSNLLIGVNKGYVYWYSGGNWQGTAASNMARYSQNDNSAYDISTTTPGGTGSAYGTRPNIQIVITAGGGGPVCEKPATMEASNVTTNSATLTWTGGSGTYNVEYKLASATDWTSYLTNTTATTCNMTGLTPGTAYQARVQSVCGSDVSGWKSVNFSTMFGIPLVEEFGTAIPSGWALYTGLMGGVLADTIELATATYGWSFGSNNGVFDNHARVNIYGTSCKNWLVLPTLAMENNVQLMFDVAYTAYSGTGAPAQTGTDDKFVVLISDGRSWTILRQWDNAGSPYVLNDLNPTPSTVTINLSSYAGSEVAIAFYGESTVSNADNNLHIDNVSIDYIPACPKPTGLAVNFPGGNTATLSWESDATAWNIDVNGTVTNITENPYTLSGLEFNTTYEVKVQASCGSDGTSEWTNPVSFKTDACLLEDMCALTFSVTDSYGDGWNSASIQVYDYTGGTVGDLLAEITNTNTAGAGEAQTYTANFCDRQELAIIWSSGSYDSECSYTVTDINGDVVVEGDGEGFTSFAYTMNCTVTDCRKPSNFEASNIGPHSAVLSWTENGPATQWVIEYMSENDTETTQITVNTNSYTLTGLDAETMYYAQVTPVCDVDKPSEVITWTTDIACPKPSDLTVTPYPTSANVEWTGFGEGYDLEWALAPTSKDEGIWLQYDNGVHYTNIGSTTAGNRTWGVRYPASMLEGNNLLSKVAIKESSYYNDTVPYTINVYTGKDQPETLVGSETVYPLGNASTHVGLDTIHEITLSTPIRFNASQNLWITMTAYGTYVMAACQSTERDNQWWDNNADGVWTNMADDNANLADYGWMIRGYVEGYDASAWSWNTMTNITSPYTITGLSPETDYVVRVRSNCGADGESGWVWAYFTTPSACDAPTDLNVTNLTHDAATLNWVGYQNSYNVQYRTAAKYVTIWEDDFENGLSDWTMVASADATYPASGIWYTIDPTSGLSFEANSGSYCASSWSWNSSAYNANNWLITPQLDLQGVLKYYVRTNAGYPDSYEVLLSTTDADTTSFTNILVDFATAPANGEWNEVVVDLSRYAGETGYIAIHHVDYDMNYLCIDDFGIYTVEDASAWISAVVTEPTLALTGLTPETDYEWQVQGINASCTGGLTDWTAIETFTTEPLTTITHQIDIVGGQWNWISTYVDLTSIDGLVKIEEALGDDAQTIQAFSDFAENLGGGVWLGLDGYTLTNQEMIMIDAVNDCRIILEGDALDASTVSITIEPQTWTWIGFPVNSATDITVALRGFDPEFDDVIQGFAGFVNYFGDPDGWIGDFSELEPGQGYMYYSNSDTAKTLTFQTAKKGRSTKGTFQQSDVMINAKKGVGTFVIDIDFPVNK